MMPPTLNSEFRGASGSPMQGKKVSSSQEIGACYSFVYLFKAYLYQVGAYVEQLELSYAAGGNVKWYNHVGKTVWQLVVKLKHRLTIRSNSSTS